MRSKFVVYPALALSAVLCASTVVAHAESNALAAKTTEGRLVTPRITLRLDAPRYDPGDIMTLRVSENINRRRTFTVRDSSGAVWTQQSDNGNPVKFTATAKRGGVVSVTMKRTVDRAKARDNVSYALRATPRITLGLDHARYRPGVTATLAVSENIKPARTFTVRDSSGAVWTQQSDNGTTVTYTTTTTGDDGNVSVTMTRTRDGATASRTASYTVSSSDPVLWPGHKPGQVILGMSCGTVCAQKESGLGQDYGVHRQFKNWGDWSGVAQDISADEAAGRLPWVSIKPPGGAGGWPGVANGTYDAAIRTLATTLKANDNQPVLITFHHEPSNDGSEAQGVQWANAYIHFNDVLDAEGALENVSNVPIVGDWLFNPTNRTQDPANWVTNGVLQRAPFLGIDMYENASGETFETRIPLITDWMAARGFPNLTVGIGETGSTAYYPRSTAVQWLNDSLGWAAANSDQVSVVSYFNSTANSRSGVYWPLDESPAKMTAYKSWLNHPLVAP